MHPLQAEARALKIKMQTLPGARLSSELDIVSTAEMVRRRRAEAVRQAELRSHQRHREEVERTRRMREAYRNTRPTTPSMNDIIRLCCIRYGVTADEIVSEARSAKFVKPRQIAIYLAATTTPRSILQIGRHFRRDHTTALHARDKIAEQIKADMVLAAEIAEMTAALRKSS
jgi:chromosomal replication initiation ATPase DnaA